jgi:hypothetical protein
MLTHESSGNLMEIGKPHGSHLAGELCKSGKAPRTGARRHQTSLRYHWLFAMLHDIGMAPPGSETRHIG